MATVHFVNDKPVEIELTTLDSGQLVMPDGELVGAFVTTYMSVAGPNSQLMVWMDDEDDVPPMYAPWNTWYASKDADSAWREALSWAQSEEIPAIRGI